MTIGLGRFADGLEVEAGMIGKQLIFRSDHRDRRVRRDLLEVHPLVPRAVGLVARRAAPSRACSMKALVAGSTQRSINTGAAVSSTAASSASNVHLNRRLPKLF